MNFENCFEDLFKSVRDYRKKVLRKILNENDENLLEDDKQMETDMNYQSLELKNNLIE